MLFAIFMAGYLWGEPALELAVQVWQDMSEAARPKLENVIGC
tara:strand:+ start:309 stop:434 length:126 start_codon:yes stop_codon:yes gene_type:complete